MGRRPNSWRSRLKEGGQAFEELVESDESAPDALLAKRKIGPESDQHPRDLAGTMSVVHSRFANCVQQVQRFQGSMNATSSFSDRWPEHWGPPHWSNSAWLTTTSLRSADGTSSLVIGSDSMSP